MKTVVILVPQGKTNVSSMAGAYEILNTANNYWQQQGNMPMLDVRLAGAAPEVKLEAGFFTIYPAHIGTIPRANLVIIPSICYDPGLVAANQTLIDWITLQYKCGAEIASLCSGAFLLAATGLLEGKTASTHWNEAAAFRRLFPNVKLQTDKLIVVQAGIYTNGGAYSFLNLILLLVEKYFDRDTAIYCSKIFQIDIDRTSQSPFAMFEAQKTHGDELVSRAQTYIEENLAQRISFEALASDLAVSRRNFDRRFTKATGNTPVEYLQRVKVEAAKKALESGRKSIFEVMSDVGYADDKSFREVFKRIVGVSPLDYRARFSRNGVIA